MSTTITLKELDNIYAELGIAYTVARSKVLKADATSILTKFSWKVGMFLDNNPVNGIELIQGSFPCLSKESRYKAKTAYRAIHRQLDELKIHLISLSKTEQQIEDIEAMTAESVMATKSPSSVVRWVTQMKEVKAALIKEQDEASIEDAKLETLIRGGESMKQARSLLADERALNNALEAVRGLISRGFYVSTLVEAAGMLEANHLNELNLAREQAAAAKAEAESKRNQIIEARNAKKVA